MEYALNRDTDVSILAEAARNAWNVMIADKRKSVPELAQPQIPSETESTQARGRASCRPGRAVTRIFL